MTKYLTYALRLCLFAVVLYLVGRNVELPLFIRAFCRISPVYLFFPLICYMLRTAVQGSRWYLAAKAHHQGFPVLSAIAAQFKIAFLEIIFILPDSEDVLKLVYLKKQNASTESATVIILFDRMIGIAVLLALMPFTLYLFAKDRLPVWMQQSVTPVLLVIVVLPFIIFHRRILAFLLVMAEKLFPALEKRTRILHVELQKKIPLLLVCACLCLAFLYALCGTMTAWLLTVALHRSVPFLYILAGIPLYYISGTLPLSLQGLGLYEATLVFVLQQLGVDQETALAVGILHFGFHIVVILTGGLLYFFDQGNEIKITLAQLKKLPAFLRPGAKERT